MFLASLLIGCTTFNDSRSVTVEDLSQLLADPTLSAKKVAITCKIVNSDGSVLSFPRVITRIDQEASLTAPSDFIYPTAFNLPETEAPEAIAHEGDKVFPATPANPTAFEMRVVGEFLKVTPRIRGSLIELTGTLTSKTVDISSLAAGEAYSRITAEGGRITITDNRVVAPEFQQIESTIRLCGRLGVEHVIHFNTQDRDVFIRIDAVN